jgi:hypothetical protein
VICTDNIKKSGSANTSQLVYAPKSYYWSQSDLTAFNTRFKTNGTITYDVGGHMDDAMCVTNASKCQEPDLDIQYMTSTGPDTPTYFYYDSNSDFLVTWLMTVSSLNPLPSVISLSYATQESTVQPAVITNFDATIISLGLYEQMHATLLPTSN